MERPDSQRIELSVSDHSQIESLEQYLNLAAPPLQVLRVVGRPAIGELGALDLLALVTTSSGLLAAIKVLPEFLRSRKTGMSITMTVNEQPFTLTATNINDVLPILERLLSD